MIATVIQQGREQFPVRISLVTIPGTVYECPSDDNRQDSLTPYEMQHVRSSKILLLIQSHKSVDLENGEECLT